ncbi:MAG: hypothetical protein ACPGVO_13080 [Spirulinaceae cyanobacterium]
MAFKVSKKKLKTDLQFYPPSGVSLPLTKPTLILRKEGDSLIYCALAFVTSLKRYEAIDRHALFNLSPEMRGQFFGQPFVARNSIRIELQLNPFLVTQLATHSSQVQGVVDYLEQLGLQQPNHVLLSTESWFATSVQQTQKKNIAGYRTFWKFVQLGEATETFTVDDFLNGVLNFLQETTDFDFAELEADIAEGLEFYQRFSQIQQQHSTQELELFLENFTEQFLTTENSASALQFPQILRAVQNNSISWSSLFEPLTQQERSGQTSDLTQDLQSLSQEFAGKLDYPDENQLLQVAKKFFRQENWMIHQTDEFSGFSVRVRGTHTEWSCLAQVNEPHEQFIFYSYCPWLVLAENKLAIAELIASINLEILVGNFDLNYGSGEIRYKTSIDVEGSHLTTSMVKQLVSINIKMMDVYLPILKQVIEIESNSSFTVV